MSYILTGSIATGQK